MASTQVNAYGNERVSQTSGRGTNGRTAGKTSLGMDDFMTLLAAQLGNQDVMNPSTDTEFIAQMAQFTSLEAMQTLTEITYAQYGASMIGQKVLVASYDDRGNYKEQKGVVESVKFAGGDCLVMVNGENYTMSAIMEVVTELPKDPPKDPDTSKPEDGGDSEDEGGTVPPTVINPPETGKE